MARATKPKDPAKEAKKARDREVKATLAAEKKRERATKAAADKVAKTAAKLAEKVAKAARAKEAKAALKAAENQLKNTREYPELTGLLATVTYKPITTLEWFNTHLPVGEKALETLAKKEKDRFVLATVRTGTAASLIAELKNTPARRWKEYLSDLARLRSDKSAAERLGDLPAKDFAAFCEANEIPVARSGAKLAISKPKSLPAALARVAEHREYLKL